MIFRMQLSKFPHKWTESTKYKIHCWVILSWNFFKTSDGQNAAGAKIAILFGHSTTPDSHHKARLSELYRVLINCFTFVSQNFWNTLYVLAKRRKERRRRRRENQIPFGSGISIRPCTQSIHTHPRANLVLYRLLLFLSQLNTTNIDWRVLFLAHGWCHYQIIPP